MLGPQMLSIFAHERPQVLGKSMEELTAPRRMGRDVGLAINGGLFNNDEGVFTMGKYLEKSGLLGSSCLSLTARSVRSCFPHSIVASQRGFGPAAAPLRMVLLLFFDVN